LFGKAVPAEEHPLTGTIYDFIANQRYYNDGRNGRLAQEANALFREYDFRNSEVNTVLQIDFNVGIGDYDTGILAQPGQMGVFFPNYDAGVGKVAYGDGPIRIEGASTRTRKYRTLAERLAEEDEEGFEP